MKFTVAGVALIKPSETLNKDKFVFVSEFSWLLEHPVYQIILHYLYNISDLFRDYQCFSVIYHTSRKSVEIIKIVMK